MVTVVVEVRLPELSKAMPPGPVAEWKLRMAVPVEFGFESACLFVSFQGAWEG